MSKAVDIIDGVLFVHTRHYDDVNRVIICHKKKPLRVFSDDAEKELGRPHGEWIAINNTHMGSEIHVCSECRKKRVLIDTPFCPWCGADMQTQNDRSFDTSGRGVSGSVENSISQKEGEAE